MTSGYRDLQQEPLVRGGGKGYSDSSTVAIPIALVNAYCPGGGDEFAQYPLDLF
jgi:hypothetical protein